MEDPWANPSPPQKAAAPIRAVAAQASDLDDGFASPSGRTFDSSASPQAHEKHENEDAAEDAGILDSADAHGAPADNESDPYAASAAIPPIDDPFDGNNGDGFDDFDDFDEPAQAGPSGTSGGNALQGAEDDFGDFDDFEDAAFEPAPLVDESADNQSMAASSSMGLGRDFRALSLSDRPDASYLTNTIHTLISPLYPSASTSTSVTSEVPREAPPLKQIMHSETSRDAYVQLCSPPSIKPLDWTRSQVRRDHLISLGIPVNLDEVDSHRLSAMPMLSVTTEIGRRQAEREREMERRYGVGVGNGPQLGSHAPARSASLDVQGRGGRGPTSRPASAHPGLERGNSYGSTSSGRRQNGLGDRPELDAIRAEELCGIEEDQLSLLKPATLKKLRDDLQMITDQASARLAWELQHKDSQTQDGVTYNGMISELITTAAKAKSAQQVASSGGVFRRSSARRPQSGLNTPGSAAGRIGSPAMR